MRMRNFKPKTRHRLGALALREQAMLLGITSPGPEMRMNKQATLITGASSGIGLALATTFASHGHPVILLARSVAALNKLAEELRKKHAVSAEVIVADLQLPDASERVAEELAARGLNVEILVNNAGFGLIGPFAALDLQRQIDSIQVNVTALTHLTRLFLPRMLERNDGGVLNVASTAAFQAGPNGAVYYATKAFVLSLTEALHEEVSATGVHVSCLCPGPTNTGFLAANDISDGINLFRFGAQSSEAVAKVGYRALQRNQAIAISGFKNSLLATTAKFSPRFVTRRIAMALNS